MKLKFFILLILTSSIVLAEGTNQSKKNFDRVSFTERVEKLVDEYHSNQLLDNFLSSSEKLQETTFLKGDGCYPTGPSCIAVACSKLGSFGCDDISEIKRVGRACRGNYNGLCLESLCSKLNSFGCDDIREIEELAPACIGNVNASCIDSICSTLGSFGCDDISEVTEVAQICSGRG